MKKIIFAILISLAINSICFASDPDYPPDVPPCPPEYEDGLKE